MNSLWYFEGNPLNHTSDMLATGVPVGKMAGDLECSDKKTQGDKPGDFTESVTTRANIAKHVMRDGEM